MKLIIKFEFEGKHKDTSLVIMRSFQYFCEYCRQIIKEELHAIQPVIRATIESAVKNILPKTVCSKEDVCCKILCRCYM